MKRFIATLLLAVMLLGMLPMKAYAATPSDTAISSNSTLQVSLPYNRKMIFTAAWYECTDMRSCTVSALVNKDVLTYGDPKENGNWKTSGISGNAYQSLLSKDWAKTAAKAVLETGYSAWQANKKLTYANLSSVDSRGYLLSSKVPDFDNGSNSLVTVSKVTDEIVNMMFIAYADKNGVLPGEAVASSTEGLKAKLPSGTSALLEASTVLFWLNGINVSTDQANRLRKMATTILGTQVVDTTAAGRTQVASAEAGLGAYPDEIAHFDQAALWSARYYTIKKLQGVTPDMSPYITQAEADAAGVAMYGSALTQAYVRSVYHITDYAPGSLNGKATTGITAGRPMDVATATYALRQYLAMDQAGQLTSVNADMCAWQYKLQATMGLASGVLRPLVGDDTNTAVTQEEIDTFLSIAYGSALEDIKPGMTGMVNCPTSSHLGEEVDVKYFYYLVLCYQELGFYSGAIIDVLGKAISESAMSFSAYGKELKALKALYDAISWADDEALWECWSRKTETQQFDGEDYKTLKSVYDYLLSENAFEGIEDYDPTAQDSAFSYFFAEPDGGNFTLSSQMKEGITASATFLPMRTNLYDPYSFQGVTSTDWLVNFHAKFGYNRKALYIDTNVDAAVNYQRTGSHGALRVCTLEDLMSADKDIVLYLDDNFYNVDKLQDVLNRTLTRLDNVDSESSTKGTLGKIWENITGYFNLDIQTITKTAEVTTYTPRLLNGGDITTVFANCSELFMPVAEAKAYLSPDTTWDSSTETMSTAAEDAPTAYTPLTAFAALSGVYQDANLLNSLNTVLTANTPVFISSPTMPYISDASASERNQIFNYLLLKNLDAQTTIDYATNLDLTSPVYMDVYGNIVTESGIVVVPAAANATLWTDSYAPYTAAFFSTYGDSYVLPYDKDSSLNDTLKTVLTPVGDEWRLTSVRVNGGVMDMAKLSTADKESLQTVSEVFSYDLGSGSIYEKPLWEMVITEALRGAPIESINKDFEGLNLSHRVTKNGLVVAEKLEFLVKALTSEGTNTTLTIPNPAYMDGIEYVVFFAFKLLILVMLCIWMSIIYLDAVGGGVNFRTGLKCLGIVVLVLSMIVGIPAAFQLSYYQSNKSMLQDETEYLMMLNLEKKEAGQEIGITDIHEPESTTKLYLKLADVEIPWYDLLPKILISSSAKNLEQLYAEYEGAHPVKGVEDVTVINDSAYVATDSLFDSSTITFSPTAKTLYQQTTQETPVSYYTPYYYFLDQIIWKANNYASSNAYYAYTTKIQRGGRLKTLGYIQPYFTSEEFMSEGMDYFGLYDLYDVTPPVESSSVVYDDDTLATIRNSQWCNMNLSDNAKIARIEKLNSFCRKWIADNKELMGKVTDETFLKCLALSCAMEHNRLFNTLRADSLEIYQLSNEDLMRLSIADHNDVMRSSTMSYARFVYSVGGTPAVYAAALLTLVNFISAWVKPIVTILVFILTFISIFVFKIILKKDNRSLYGYVTTILLMCMVNVVGAAFLKLSMYIPATGCTPTVCILIQVLVQCGYIFMLLWIVKMAVKDWPNMGFQRYDVKFNQLVHRHQYAIDVDTPMQKNGWDYYNRLIERQKRRHRSL